VIVATSPWDSVIGQPDAVAALQATASQPSHAYLLQGPRGAGARAVARAFAAVILADGLAGDEAARAEQLALDEKHPDLHVFERTGAYISVEVADAIIREASRSPVEATRKVLVLVDFHLVREAGPKLLKIIEEPPASTVFVVLAESVPPELVPIASRCLRIELDAVPADVVAALLVREGTAPDAATEIAIASGGDVDRARLLARDPRFKLRQAAWYSAPDRLDGSGSAVVALVAELRSMIDDVAAPIDALHAEELAELEARVEQYGERGSGRRELIERQKREVRRLRTDDLRFGLATLASRYRDELASGSVPGARSRPILEAIARINDANEAIIRNPNEALLLQALLLGLPGLRASAR
jgi:DNA polymerase-3 subunit delta'